MSFSNDVFINSITAAPVRSPPTQSFVIGPIPAEIAVVVVGLDGSINIGNTVVGSKAKFVLSSFLTAQHVVETIPSVDRYGREEVSYKISHYSAPELKSIMYKEFLAITNQEAPAPVVAPTPATPDSPWADMLDDDDEPEPVDQEEPAMSQAQIRENLVTELAHYCERAGLKKCKNGSDCTYFDCTYSHGGANAKAVMQWKNAKGNADRLKNLRSMSTIKLIEAMAAIVIKETNCAEEINVLKNSLAFTGSHYEFHEMGYICENSECDARHIKH